MAFMFARDGVIRDINFRLTRNEIDCNTSWRNKDGIDLRIGCINIEIANITGEVGDDMVALTALGSPMFELEEKVRGKDTNIEDIYIHNIRGIINLCAIIRLLAHLGNKIRRITHSRCIRD